MKLSIIKIFRAVIFAIILLLIFITGLEYLSHSESVRWLFEKIPSWVPITELPEFPLTVLGFLCLIAPILYLCVSWIDLKMSSGIVGRGKDGKNICLTGEAVSRTVTTEVKANVPEVARVRTCSVTQGANTAKVFIDIAVSDKKPIPEVQAKVRSSVQDTLERLIGYANGKQVRVRVSRIQNSKPVQRKKKSRAALSTEAPKKKVSVEES